MAESDTSTRVRQVTVPEDRQGQRLDNFLLGLLGQVPRSLVYRLVRTGQVRVNGGRAKPMQKLMSGDQVRVPPVRHQAPKRSEVPSGLVEEVKSRTIEQNRDFVVLDKPAGLAMHGGTGLSYGLMDAIAQINADWRPVHRLDRPTSGLLVLACHHQALVNLQKAFRERSVEKRYLSLLSGRLAEDRVTIDAPLLKIRDGSGQRRIVVAEEGQLARSHFSVLERLEGFTFVEVEIETGRTHQIRAHAAHMGHPVAGDELYNDGQDPEGLKRLFLHSHLLRLSWPDDSLFSSPLPDTLSEVLNRLRSATKAQPQH
jgi:23S rRNA pseudouridine955/2504/2580 synthase